MATALDRSIRKTLERAITGKDGAREIAERGARKALIEIALEEAKRPDGMSDAQINLRNSLRAHARSLGDVVAADGSIKANRLVREIAYEHWHRALFARFLAENNLLIEPEHKVAVSLSELEEIAKEEGRDLVELAADWAEPMLPQIFRKDDPVLALTLPPETKGGIIDIVKGLPSAVFAADDSLGWVYQFWQADEKNRVSRSEVKIGADELPAVTQLFTEDYMVLFLLENTLGAWWAGKVLAADTALAARAASEEQLREKTSPPGYRWSYLRFVREPREGETYDNATGPWRPAAGIFEGWPKAAKDITMLDPCMGSGHFPVFALPIFIALRRAEEELDERAAVKAVLAENLFGLEIDPRCTQIAAFALALASWKRLGAPELLPRLNLACSGLAIGLDRGEFLKLAEKIANAEGRRGQELAATRIRSGLERLYELFGRAPYLGSLIDPRRAVKGDFGNLFEASFEGLENLLGAALGISEGDYVVREAAVTAQGVSKAAELLSRQFTLVATNVPFLGWRDMSGGLQSYVKAAHKDYKGDLGYCLWNRFARSHEVSSTVAIISLQHWLTLKSYVGMRQFILTKSHLRVVCYVGTNGFETISGQKVNVTLSITSSAFKNPGKDSFVTMIDLSRLPSAAEKAAGINSSRLSCVSQAVHFASPNHAITLSPRREGALLGQAATCLAGIMNGDSDKFLRHYWEIPTKSDKWTFLQSTVGKTSFSGGLSSIIDYDEESGHLREDAKVRREKLHNSDQRGNSAWGRRGVAISQMSNLPAALYFGNKFDSNVAVILPEREDHVAAIWTFVSSEVFVPAVRNLNKKIGVGNGYFLNVLFDLPYWQRIAGEKYPNGLPKAYSNDPTQWLFDGDLRGSADPNLDRSTATNARLVTALGVRPGLAEHPLQVAAARLLGYRWPRQTGSSFMDCPAVTEPDEVDRSGLGDTDGIVPLPALAGEADAGTRLRDLIRVVWGPDYSEGTIRELLAAEEAKTADLGAWLADEFFDGHCNLFHQTPFIWHVWDGVRGGFSALVNYHRLCEGNGAGRRLLEKLRDSYLGEWIAGQRRALAAGEPGAEDRLIAAEHLRGELTKIIEGEPPYDIFVRWKPLHRQPIGWEPDIDDGVRLNIRPFLTARPKSSGRRDACILRVTPRVKKHAGADRGAEPHREKQDFPWFWAEDDDVATQDFPGGPVFKGRRYNDFHYSRVCKERARDAKAEAASNAATKRALQESGTAS